MSRRYAIAALCLIATGAVAAGAAHQATPKDEAGREQRPSEPGGRVAEARRTLAALNVQEVELAARIGHNRAELAQVLGALQLFARQPPPALLVTPGEVKDSVRGAILLKAIAPALEARARGLSAEAATLAAVRRRAAAANGDLFAAESAQEDRRSRLEGVMSDAEVLSPPAARAAAAAAVPELPPARLSPPVAGRASAGFAGRLADGLKSHGLAYVTDAGAPVTSPAAAVVDYAGPLNGWGQVVILRASGGCHMVLSGLGKLGVRAGQSVAAGQVVGTMPKDGQSVRELYFEVRLRGVPVDPARLLTGPSPPTTLGKAAPGALRGALKSG